MSVDPRYYIPQVVFFVLGAILFGFFFQALQAEIALRGPGLSPRLVWLICLCVSSFAFLVIQIDPLGALGIFDDSWQSFVGVIDASLLLASLSAAIYMYVIVSYTRFKSQVPRAFSYAWALSNSICISLVCLFELIGALTDNTFWFGMGMLVCILQETVVLIGLQISYYTVLNMLKELEQRNGADYQAQRRKVQILRLITLALATAAIINQFLTSNLVGQLQATSYGVPLPPLHLDTFQINLIVPDLLTILGHAMLLYMLRRPSDEDSKTPSRISQAQLTAAASLSVVPIPASPSFLRSSFQNLSPKNSFQTSALQLPKRLSQASMIIDEDMSTSGSGTSSLPCSAATTPSPVFLDDSAHCPPTITISSTAIVVDV